MKPAGPRAFVNARMHQLVENEQIATLRQRRQNGEIGHISAAEEDRGFGAEEPRGRGLQALMLRAISAQKPRSAGADRGAGLARRPMTALRMRGALASAR